MIELMIRQDGNKILTVERWGKWNGKYEHIYIDVENNKIYKDGKESEEITTPKCED